MTAWYLLIVLITVSFQVALSYSTDFKASSAFIPIGLVLALIVNYTWLYISRTVGDPSELYKVGVVFDFIVASSWLLVPLLLGVKLSPIKFVGVGLMLSGVLIINFSK